MNRSLCQHSARLEQERQEQLKIMHQEEQKQRTEYVLVKRRPGCTGMFWRSDPTGKSHVASNRDWPRDNAVLRGEVVTVRGQKWLHASNVRQFYDKEFVKAPENAYMPFEYNNHYCLEVYKERKRTEKVKKKEKKTEKTSQSLAGLFGWMKRNKTNEPVTTTLQRTE